MTVPPPAPPPASSPEPDDFQPPDLPEWVEDLGEPVDPEVAAAERKRALREKVEKSAAFYQVDELGKILGRQRATKAANELVNGRHVRLKRASSYPTLATRWMWAGRIPVGEITLVCGREGVGKSTWFAWLAAQVTRGALEGQWHGRPRDVWYVATEDSWSHTIKPRMEAAGADLDRVHHLLVEVDEVGMEKPVLPLDVRHLVAEVRRVRGLLDEARDHGLVGEQVHPDAGDPAMLMLDPAISVIDEKINTFNAKELRTALEPLKTAAEVCDIAVVGLAHFNKTKDADVMTMVAGARAWVEVARAVIAIAVDKEADEYTCVLSQIKNNLGRSDLPNLAYTLDSVPVRTDSGGTTEVGAVRWTGESGRSAEELLGERGVPGPARGEAYEKVVDHVAGMYRVTGSALSLRDIVNNFGADLTEVNVKKILRRAVQRGDLSSPTRSMYGPPAGSPSASGPVRATAETSRCVMPNCESIARVGRPMCADCERDLDSQDKQLRSVQDPLWDGNSQEG
jgi:hypothetical protein